MIECSERFLSKGDAVVNGYREGQDVTGVPRSPSSAVSLQSAGRVMRVICAQHSVLAPPRAEPMQLLLDPLHSMCRG